MYFGSVMIFRFWIVRVFHTLTLSLFLLCGGSLFALDGVPKGLKAVIFDCDGVLVDTEYLKFLAWQDALSSHGVEFTIEEYMPLVGHSAQNILKMIGELKHLNLSDEIIELRNLKYKELQKEGVPPIKPMIDFARSISENREESGLKLGLASSAPREEILMNLKQIDLEDAFDLVISGADDLDDYIDESGKNKPKPYIYMESAKRLNVLPEECLVFEDTNAGVEAAADAGMVVIAVPNRFTLYQDFSKASHVVSSSEELSLLND